MYTWKYLGRIKVITDGRAYVECYMGVETVDAFTNVPNAIVPSFLTNSASPSSQYLPSPPELISKGSRLLDYTP